MDESSVEYNCFFLNIPCQIIGAYYMAGNISYILLTVLHFNIQNSI